MMAEQDNDETRACGLWLYMTRMLSVRYAVVVNSLSGLVYMLRGNRECVGVLIYSEYIRTGKGLTRTIGKTAKPNAVPVGVAESRAANVPNLSVIIL